MHTSNARCSLGDLRILRIATPKASHTKPHAMAAAKNNPPIERA